MWIFSGFKPVCPVDEDLREWVDGRFRWLQQQLGEETPRKVRVVLPTPEFFPDPYHATEEDARSMLARVAGYMDFDPGQFRLFVYQGGRVPSVGAGLQKTRGAAGLYLHGGETGADGKRRAVIGIEESQLADPMSLVATLAHEVGHEVLIGGGRVTEEDEDHEPLTDLVTVFMGMGIFGANATIRDRAWSDGTMAGWETRRLGYLDQRTFGYALARFARSRSETNPPWARFVRPDVRAPLKQGLRFLARAPLA